MPIHWYSTHLQKQQCKGCGQWCTHSYPPSTPFSIFKLPSQTSHSLILGLYSGFAKMLLLSSMWTWTVHCGFLWKTRTTATFLKLALEEEALTSLQGNPGRWLASYPDIFTLTVVICSMLVLQMTNACHGVIRPGYKARRWLGCFLYFLR